MKQTYKKIALYTGLAGCLFLYFMAGCKQENDFYEVGRQPAYLSLPAADTSWVLDYQRPDTLYKFAWYPKRNFIDYNLIFSVSEDMEEKRYEVFTGVRSDFSFSTMQVDSILSKMEVGIGQKQTIYWSVEVIDPEVGWCDEVRTLHITRCDLPANVIFLETPGSLEEVILDREEPEEVITFTWRCETTADAYLFRLGLTEELTEGLEINCGQEHSLSLSQQALDEWVAAAGVHKGEMVPLYWQVTGSGNLTNPIEDSAVREIAMQRFVPEPVEVTLLQPIAGEEIFLQAAQATEEIVFAWECDTTGVEFKVLLYDKELEKEVIWNAGETSLYALTQLEFDQLLEQEFEMVPSQKKKMYWEVIPDDTIRAVSGDPGEFIVRRFEAATAAPPVILTDGPANGTRYVLEYSQSSQVATTLQWEADAPGVTYTMEYSLSEEFTTYRTKELGTAKSYAVTQGFLDEILSGLGGAYLTRTVYWRINSTVNVMTQPSEIRYMVLTGMVKPLTDLRDPARPETYEVVKIGNNFWLAENLRATMYSDGTAFTTVDLPSKTYTGGVVADPGITGQYYSWPTALRDWQKAGESDHTILQGVCPEGWHVSTKRDWEDLLQTLSPESAKKAKANRYWGNLDGVTNESGLSLVPAGYFWHANVGDNDILDAGADGKSAYWTTTVGSETTAYMYEVFNWDAADIIPWHYASRPWSEGDGTASRAVNVRCVRTIE